jgi:hypothetical protein|tara:strand:- start:2691 stop:3335 length:645 start_codon:yes stop_codon:yes gene_type:complete
MSENIAQNSDSDLTAEEIAQRGAEQLSAPYKLAAEMLDSAWSSYADMFRNETTMDRSGQGTKQEEPSSSPNAELGDLWKPWIDFMSAPFQGRTPDSQVTGVDSQAILSFVTEAYRLAMSNGIQYWTRNTELAMRYLPTIADNLSAMNSDDQESNRARAVLIDTLRTWMCEFTDMSQQESRKLQAEFESLVGDLWLSESTDQDEGEYRRFWRTKR